MRGGGNADTFVFVANFGDDEIFDFNVNEVGELIDLSGVVEIDSFTDLTANHLSQNGAHAIIDAGDGNGIQLTNVNMADLTADHFSFV